ncbi:MAG TPA: DNA-binding domain-containing protein [Pseudobdellovibrionaceae bacterium]|nr:DNA-binding domain-containing protein [Pseudobdellovibrionaceae bacterium]
MSAVELDLNQKNMLLFFNSIETRQPKSVAEFQLQIEPGGELNAQAALAVYQNGYFARLTEAMGGTYEALWAILGDEDFFALCREYIEKYPSLSCDLSDYGAHMAEFLQENPRIQDFPFLSELAKYCWIRNLLFHTQDEVGLQAHEVQLTPDSIIEFVPHFANDQFSYAIQSIWRMAMLSQDPNSDEAETPSIESFLHPSSVFLWKDQQQVRVSEASTGLGHFFERLKNKTPVGIALEDDSLNPQEIEWFFQTVAQQGLISRVLAGPQ